MEVVPKQCHHSAVFRSSCCEMVLSKMIHKLGSACRYPVLRYGTDTVTGYNHCRTMQMQPCAPFYNLGI